MSENEIENTYGYKTITTQIYADVVSQIYEEPNAIVSFVEDDLYLFSNDTTMQIFAGKELTYSQNNSYSPFILLSHNQHTVLLTGDATQEREMEFLETLSYNSKNLNIDFLQVSHHGSKNNSSETFLQAVKPKFAIVSAGEKGYPNDIVLERLESVGTQKVYITKEVGMIALGVDDKYVVKMKTESIDLPFILVMLICVVFCWFDFLSKNDRYIAKLTIYSKSLFQGRR